MSHRSQSFVSELEFSSSRYLAMVIRLFRPADKLQLPCQIIHRQFEIYCPRLQLSNTSLDLCTQSVSSARAIKRYQVWFTFCSLLSIYQRSLVTFQNIPTIVSYSFWRFSKRSSSSSALCWSPKTTCLSSCISVRGSSEKVSASGAGCVCGNEASGVMSG